VTLIAGLSGDDTVAAEIRTYVGERIGKLARPKSIIWAEDLPKTRSGKIMRRLLRDLADGRDPGDVTTLADASVLQRLQDKVAARSAITS
jgi:acetyl-CoA synthetase